MKIFFEKINHNPGQVLEKEEDNDNDLGAWMQLAEKEGQLSIDVYETADNIVVQSTIAGVKSTSLDISLHNDMLTIKGERKKNLIHPEAHYLYQECFWGKFSRTIILPHDVRNDKVSATIEDGVLTVILPIDKSKKKRFIKVKEISS